MGTVTRLSERRRQSKQVFFNRQEINRLVSVYSRRVIRGEWRDYAIRQEDNLVAFCIYRHGSEHAAFTVVKYRSGSDKRGDFAVFDTRRQLKRGRTIADVLKALEPPLRLVSG